jgi:predicted acyltransferase
MDESQSTAIRWISIDAFRGFVISRMLVGQAFLKALQSLPQDKVPATVLSQLHHSPWHGLTWVDFSFSGFVMIMGLSVRLSLKGLVDAPLRVYMEKVIFRSLMLLVLGLLLNGGFSRPWPDIRLCGVLQRIAICYFSVAMIYRWMSVRQRTCVLVFILLGYWALLALVAVSGYSAGDYSFEGNLAAWVDGKLLPGRLFFGTWDPEGILTTIPAIASGLIGLLWGDFLYGPKSMPEKAAWLAAVGLLAINLGVAWDLIFPINKPLWTSSFVTVTAGIGSLLLAIFLWAGEVMKWHRLLFPFVVIGRNLLVAYVIVQILPIQDIALRFSGGDVTLLLGSLAPFFSAAVEILLIWSILYFLYRNGVSVRL